MRFLEYVLSFFPTQLPVGMTEFTKWQDSILRMSPVPDNDSTRFASAVMILHLDSTVNRKPKQYFIRALHKSAANEVANSVAMSLKEKQKAEHEARIAADVKRSSDTDTKVANAGPKQV